MTEPDEFPTADRPVGSIDPDDLKTSIERGDRVTILDVRASSEFDEWRIEGPSVTIENIPYFEFLDDDIEPGLLDRVPRGDPLVVVCAKGGASEYVAGKLLDDGREAVNLAEGMNGWAGIYEAVEITTYSGPGAVIQYQRPSSGCLAYLIHDGQTAAVVDPLRAFTDRYLDDAAELGVDLELAFDTHIHADHVSGLRSLANRGVTVYLPELAADRGIDYEIDYELVQDGDAISLGQVEIEAIHTPGHTSGMTSYRAGNVLLTGDGLFTESFARPDLEEGADGAPAAAGTLYDTLIDRVFPLPGDLMVAPGHFSDVATRAPDNTYTARLADLEEVFTELDLDREGFIEFVLDDMPPRPGNFEDIIAINLGQQRADDDEAFRLELGPNNCAATQGAISSD